MAKKPKVPWPDEQYYVDEAEKTVWLLGSYMRALYLHHSGQIPVPGYEVKLATSDYIKTLKEKKNAEEERPTDPRGSSSSS